jgi:phosphohistidine phosphatase SixA
VSILAGVLVYLCRHAKAAPGEPDELRELTGKGRRQAEALGDRLAAATQPPVLVLTSPLVRARQTAEAIAAATGAALEVDRRLAPGATLAALRDAVAAAKGPVATVGHQPDALAN